jgi:hypothetical protein
LEVHEELHAASHDEHSPPGGLQVMLAEKEQSLQVQWQEQLEPLPLLAGPKTQLRSPSHLPLVSQVTSQSAQQNERPASVCQQRLPAGHSSVDPGAEQGAVGGTMQMPFGKPAHTPPGPHAESASQLWPAKSELSCFQSPLQQRNSSASTTWGTPFQGALSVIFSPQPAHRKKW